MPKLLLLSIALICCNCSSNNFPKASKLKISPRRVVMFLSALGVESGGFPTIHATLDFKNKFSICKVSYYEPWLKDSSYSLTDNEMNAIFNMLATVDLLKTKINHRSVGTDQPTSTTTIYLSGRKLKFEDYGLIAEYPFNEMYRIVYKLGHTFR